jgi:hypothetical protein
MAARLWTYSRIKLRSQADTTRKQGGDQPVVAQQHGLLQGYERGGEWPPRGPQIQRKGSR